MAKTFVNSTDEIINDFEQLVKYEKLTKNRTKTAIFDDMFKMYQKTKNYKEYAEFKSTGKIVSKEKASA